MITTNTGAKKIENSDNWREIFDAHNTSVDAADRIQPEVAPIINGKQCALSVAVGNFVLLRNSTISGKADGAYEVTKAIPANTNLDSTYIANNPIGGGIANELNSNLSKHYVRIASQPGSDVWESVKATLNLYPHFASLSMGDSVTIAGGYLGNYTYVLFFAKVDTYVYVGYMQAGTTITSFVFNNYDNSLTHG